MSTPLVAGVRAARTASSGLEVPPDRIYNNCMMNEMNKNDKCKCGDCGAPVTWEWDPPYQEYPGARVWGGEWIVECEKCDWCDATKQDLSSYSIQENTRGW